MILSLHVSKLQKEHKEKPHQYVQANVKVTENRLPKYDMTQKCAETRLIRNDFRSNELDLLKRKT